MRRAVLTLICTIFVLTTTSHTWAQNANQVSVYIDSTPQSVEVQVGGKVIGITPFQITLPQGIYTFDFISATLPKRSIQAVIIGKTLEITEILSDAQLDQNLLQFPGNTILGEWSNVGDLLRVTLFYGQYQPVEYVTLKLDQRLVQPDSPKLDVVDDSLLRQRLNTDKTIFKSPLGTYLLYESPQTQQLVLLNTKTGGGDLSTFLGTPERVVWNPDESRAWLVQNNGQLGAFLFMTESGVEVKYMPVEVYDASNTPIRTSFVLSYPTTDQRVPFIGFATRDDQILEGLYLLNLETNQVTIVKEQVTNEDERNRVYDAKFSADERYLYVVYLDRIVRYDQNFQLEIISQVQKSLGDLAYAKLSPSLRYVFLFFGSGGSTSGAWVYKMP